MKETSATSKKLHQLSTPIKVNFDVCPKYHVMMDYKYFATSALVDIGFKVSQRGSRVTGIFL